MFLGGSELCIINIISYASMDGKVSGEVVQKRGSIRQYRTYPYISSICMKTRSVEAEEAAGEELLMMERRWDFRDGVSAYQCQIEKNNTRLQTLNLIPWRGKTPSHFSPRRRETNRNKMKQVEARLNFPRLLSTKFCNLFRRRICKALVRFAKRTPLQRAVAYHLAAYLPVGCILSSMLQLLHQHRRFQRNDLTSHAEM